MLRPPWQAGSGRDAAWPAERHPSPAARGRRWPGDLIICTSDDHRSEAGEPGRTLANATCCASRPVTGRGLLVRRALDADPATGARGWTERCFLYISYQTPDVGTVKVTNDDNGQYTFDIGFATPYGDNANVALYRGTPRREPQLDGVRSAVSAAPCSKSAI